VKTQNFNYYLIITEKQQQLQAWLTTYTVALQNVTEGKRPWLNEVKQRLDVECEEQKQSCWMGADIHLHLS